MTCHTLSQCTTGGVLLLDACNGEVARGTNTSPSLAAKLVEVLVGKALSKGSKTWGGSMFGSPSSMDAPKGSGIDESYFDRRS